MADQKALKHRRALKAKKPEFLRQDAHKRAKFRPASWRKPKGLHSKLGRRGYNKAVQVGWRSPVAVRGMSREGFEPIVISTLAELSKLDVKTQGAVISAAVGARRREELLKKAQELKVTVLNLKTEDTLKRIGAARAKRKAEVAGKREEKRKKETKKPVEQIVEEKSDEEKKDELEAEKQKVLTQSKQ